MKPPLSALLLLGAAVPSCGPAEPVGATAPLLAEPAVAVFDRIPNGSAGGITVRLTNPGDAPLRLTRIGPMPCDCTIAALRWPDLPPGETGNPTLDRKGYTDTTLPPGSAVLLDLVLDTAGFRKPISTKSGRFAIHSEGREPFLLEYRADIYVPYRCEPAHIDLQKVGVHERPRAEAVIWEFDEKEFVILPPPEPPDGWDVRVEPVVGGDHLAYRVHLRGPPEMPRGPFRIEFAFPSNLPDSPPARLTLQGVVEDDIYPVPGRFFVLLTEQRPPTSQIELRSRLPERPPAIFGFEIDGDSADRLTIEELPVASPGRLPLLLRWQGPPPDRPQRGHIILRTNDPERPELRVPYAIRPDSPPPAR